MLQPGRWPTSIRSVRQRICIVDAAGALGAAVVEGEMPLFEVSKFLSFILPHRQPLRRVRPRRRPLRVAARPDSPRLMELVVPVRARTAAPRPSATASRQYRPWTRLEREAITSPPGGEWLFVKVYLPQDEIDAFLADKVTSLLARVDDANMADEWFFIRYADRVPPPAALAAAHGARAGLTPGTPALNFWYCGGCTTCTAVTASRALCSTPTNGK